MEANKARLELYRSDDMRQKEWNTAGEPCRDWDKVLCQREMEHIVNTSIKIVDKMSEKSERSRLASVQAPLEQLVCRLSEQRRRVESALMQQTLKKQRQAKAREDKARAAEAKEQRELAAEQETANRKMRRNIQVMTCRSYKVLDVPDAAHPMRLLPKAALKDPLDPSIFQAPFRVKDMVFGTEFAGEEDIRNSLEAFATDFRKAPNYSNSGRGTRAVDLPLERVSLLTQAVRNCCPSCPAIEAELSATDRELFSFPWWFGFSRTMASVGPEFAFLGSLKWQMCGKRLLVCAPYKAIADFMRHQMPHQTPSLIMVSNFLQEADAARVTAMKEFGVELVGAMVEEPARWCMLILSTSEYCQPSQVVRYL
jgi:hypothetical protein